jgi:PAS domain S-box-containing protein
MNFRNHWLVRYVSALLAVAAAFLLRAGLTQLGGGNLPTYITFYPAVMLSALLGGVGPGLLATLVAALGADYFLLTPVGSFAVESLADAVGLAFFTGMGVFMSVVAELYRRARQQAAESEAAAYLRDHLEPPARWSRQGLLLNAGFVASLAILAVAAWQSARNVRAVEEADQLVTHTYVVIQDLDRLLSALKDEETGQRGYLLTGEDQYLEPYQAALGIVKTNLADLKRIVRDPSQQQRLEVIEGLVAEMEAIIRKTIELRRSQGLPAALAVVTTDTGKITMDQIRAQVAAAQNAESLVLQQRIEASNAETGKTVQALMAGSILSFLLLITVFLFLKQENVRRTKAEADARLHRDHLQEIVAARTDELAKSNEQLKVEIDGHLQAREALRQQREYLRVTLTSIGDAVLVTDLQGKITFLNPVAESLTGWPESVVLGQPAQSVFRIINEKTRAPGEDIVARVLREKQTVALANHTALLARDGREVPIEDSAAPIRDDTGAISGAVLVFHDVTEKRRLHEQVAQEKDRLSALIGSVSDEIWFADTGGKFTLLNPTGSREFSLGVARGVGVEELAASLEVLRPDGTPRPIEETPPLRALRGEIVRNQEEIVRTPATNELRHRQVSSSPVKDAAGKIIGSVSVVRDITDIKRAEAAIRQSESRYRTLFDTMIEGFCIIEVIFDAQNNAVDYRFLEINPAFERQTGLHDARGKLMRDLAPAHEAHWFEIYGKVALTGEPARFVNEARALGRWYDVSAYRVGAPESRRVAILFSDITQNKRAEAARAQLAAIVESSDDGILSKDLGGVITSWNAGAARLLGYRPDEVIGRPINLLLPSDRQDEEDAIMARLQAGQKVDHFETVRLAKDGRRLDVSVTISPLMDAQGRVVGASKIIRDITERKHNERQLRLLSTAVESAANGIAVTDRAGNILWINPAFTRMTGYSSAEAVGQNPRVLKSGRHPTEFYCLMWSTLLKGEPWHGEMVNRRKDGSLYPEEMTIAPVRVDGTEITHYVAIKQDITARKRAERRTELLAETAARLLSSEEPQRVVEELCRKVLDFLDCQVFFNFLVNDQQQRLHLNACAGIPAADAAKIEWLDFGVAVCGCAARDACRIVAANIQETPDPRTELVKPYGIQAYACHPLIVADHLLGTLSFGTRTRKDFTEEELSFMKAVSDLVATAMERKRTQAVLQLTVEEAKRSNRDLEQFAYIASHDLQEPLRAVGGYVRLIQRRFPQNMDAKALQFINGAAEGADRMERLINDLLAFSRVGTHGGAFSPASLDAILNEALRNLHSSIESAQAKVTHDALPTLAVDATQMMQIFQNLIGNAIKFHSERPPEIHVGAKKEPGRWVFSVRDNGIGIQAQYFDRIFQIFQRLHTRHHYPGTGIGLAICKKMVERHGGVIWVESTPGQGSTFYFSLPDTSAMQ